MLFFPPCGCSLKRNVRWYLKYKQHFLNQSESDAGWSKTLSACYIVWLGTFWLMRFTHGEVQLLKSGPWGSQYPSGPMHMYEAMPGEGTKTVVYWKRRHEIHPMTRHSREQRHLSRMSINVCVSESSRPSNLPFSHSFFHNVKRWTGKHLDHVQFFYMLSTFSYLQNQSKSNCHVPRNTIL